MQQQQGPLEIPLIAQSLLNQPPQQTSSPLKQPSISDKTQKYDGDAIPPNFEIAKRHGKAQRVYRFSKDGHDDDDDDCEACPCCGLQPDGEKLSIFCKISDLYHLGSGYSLYFNFLKYTVGLLALIFAISGIYNLITNMNGNDCPNAKINPNDDFCATGIVIDMSLANKRDDNSLLTAQVGLNLFVMLSVAAVFHFVRYSLRKTAVDADDEAVTPADYTVFVSGLPKDATDEEIKTFIEDFSKTEGQPIECQKITRAHDIEGYAEHEFKKDQLLKQIRSSLDENQKVVLERDLEQLETEWKNKMSGKEHKYTNKAFVSLKHAQMADCLIKKFKKVKVVGFLNKVNPFSDNFDELRGNKIRIRRAAEPTDILWENLGYTESQRFKYKIVTSVITILILVASFFAILGLYWVQDYATKAGASSLVLTGIYYGISVLLCVINTVLSTTIRILAGSEKCGTKTGYLTAIAGRQSVALLINTAFTSLLVQIALGSRGETFIESIKALDIYGPKGLVESMFSVFVINAIYSPIYNIFDPFYFIALIKQRLAINQGGDAILTQEEANALFEGTQSDLSLKYSSLIKTILLTCFYAPVMPIAIPITIGGLILTYWVDKYLLLRRNALPTSLGDELSTSMIEYLEWMTFTFSAGNIFFLFTLQNSHGDGAGGPLYTALVWITFGLSMIHILLPMDMINERLFKIKDEVTENQDFNEARNGFTTDYDIQNPVTREEAVKEILKAARKRHDESSFKKIKKMLTMNKNIKNNLEAGIYGVIMDEEQTISGGNLEKTAGPSDESQY